MKEKLYTIPVNDAYQADCECPLCSMYHNLEESAIDFVMGPSYMEDDIREVTNKIGFCQTHVQKLYKNQNRLGLALMLHTHMQKVTKDLEKLSKGALSTGGLFKKKSESNGVVSYVKSVTNRCYVCERIDNTFERYVITILYLYRTDEDFRKIFRNAKGVCMAHYATLTEYAPRELSGSTLKDFINDLNQTFLNNMSRIQDDLEWFIDKFDYRNSNEPWRNSKDALLRSVTKLNSTYIEE